MRRGAEALTEKERVTLRLMAEGHDAKSLARHLGLSVHTVNERLRDARRKLDVSSSREAARILRSLERTTPQSVGDEGLGDAPRTGALPDAGTPRADPRSRRYWLLGGFIMLVIIAAALVLNVAPGATPSRAPAIQQIEVEASSAATRWLALVDARDWPASFAATASQFRALNTLEGWTAASLGARGPLGPVVTRTMVAHDFVAAPPSGYEQVRFRTDFSARRGVIETVTLAREDGQLRVVGYLLQ